MKTFKLFEASIIGLLVGVVVSIYILFMDTMGRDFGSILNTISLTDSVRYFPVQYQNSIVFNFLFYIFVYILYSIVLTIIFRVSKKAGVGLSIVVIILMVGSVMQQINSFKKPIASEEFIVEPGNLANAQTLKKYFGEEVVGDLNQDQIDDVAFLIKRNEGDERGDMYYLSASLKTPGGYEGLNLMYVGEKILIDALEIKEGIIIVSYKNLDSSEMLQYKVKLVDNKLVDEDIEGEEGESV